MNERIEKLLQPVSADQPCGPDPANDPALFSFEELLKGKPEREMGETRIEAEPPDWREVRTQAISLLEKSKDLNVSIALCCGLLRTEGLPGFRDGLELVRGLLENFWATLHPALDPEDNNDPTQRVNQLRTLTSPRGSVPGWLTIIDYLYDAPLCEPPGLPPITLSQLLAGGADGGPSRTSLETAMRSASPDKLEATLATLREAQAAAKGVDEFLTKTIGAGQAIDFGVLHGTLKELVGTIQPVVEGGDVPSEAGAPSDGSAAPAASGGAAVQISGTIQSRQDVVRTLERICDYYRQVEPGSPVPYLLRRAQRLATMSFVQAVTELSVGSVETMKPSLGSAVEAESGQDESASS